MSSENGVDIEAVVAYHRRIAREEALKVFEEKFAPALAEGGEWLTVSEAAQELQVSIWSVYEMCKRGDLRHERTGAGKKLIRIGRGDVHKKSA